MLINGIQIDDTFAEAFNMRGTRIIITAQNLKWAYHAANAMTGFATSVIGCGVEAVSYTHLDVYKRQTLDLHGIFKGIHETIFSRYRTIDHGVGCSCRFTI